MLCLGKNRGPQIPYEVTIELEALEKANQELEQKLKERDSEIEKLQEALSNCRPNKDLEKENQELEQKLKERSEEIEGLQETSFGTNKANRGLEQQLKEHDEEIETVGEDLARGNLPTEKTKSGKTKGIAIVPEQQPILRNAVKKTEKTWKQRKFLGEAIINNDFLKHLNRKQINEMIDSMQRFIPVNDTFIKEGTNGDRLYILESGELKVSKGKHFLRNITPPSVFGELALLYRCKRTATVTAKSPTRVWMIERTTFLNITRTTNELWRAELIKALCEVPLMKTLGRSKLGKLAEVLEEETFDEGQYIVRQGEAGEIFYIIMEGEVGVTEQGQEDRSETLIRILGKGSYFGEKALRSETGKRETNVIAKSKVRCMTLEKHSFLSLIGNMADKDWQPEKCQPKPDNVPRHTETGDHMPSSLKNYPLRDFEFVGVLGIGGFGRVELVRLKEEPNRSFALKCMKKTYIVEMKQQEHIISEKKIMLDSDCRFIVQLYKTFKNDKCVYLLMEACLGGELWAKLRDDGYFDEQTTRFYAACVLEAIEFLHLRGVVYRDLKPENLVLDERGFVKIIDFGFAKRIDHGEKTWTVCGTPEYVAPEVILNKGHDVAVDYWALGVLIFEMLTGNPPFNSPDPLTTHKLVIRGIDAIEWPLTLSKSAWTLIRRLCRENPAQRIGNLRGGINDIRNHRWFSGFDWISLKNGTYNAPYVPEIASPTDLRNFDRFEREEEMVEEETSGWDKDF